MTAVSRRGLAGAAIVLLWLANLGWLAARRMGESREKPLESRGTRLAPGASFYAVRVGRDQLGTAGVTLDTTSVGFRIVASLSLDLPTGSGSARHVYREEAILTRSLRVQRLTGTLSEAGAGRTREAVTSDSARLLRLTESGRPATLDEFRSETGASITTAVPFRMAASGRLRPGGSLPSDVISALDRTLTASTARATTDSVFAVADSAVLDQSTGLWVPAATESVRAWRVERQERGLPMIEWIDARGRVLSSEQAFGVSLVLAPFEVSYSNYQTALRQKGRVSGDLPGATHLAAGSQGPDSMATEVRVVVARSDGPAWPGAARALSGGRQIVSGDTVHILRQSPGTDSTPPPRGRNTAPPAQEDHQALLIALREALAQEPFEPDTLRRLARWVAHAVQYLDTPEAPSGKMTVLRSRRGGTEGKVDLLVALAEMAGMPARPVVGVDVSRHALPAHAWVEVWRDGWIAVDPVFGQVPASAFLLRITEGLSPRPLGMVPLIGGLRATLVSPRRPGRVP